MANAFAGAGIGLLIGAALGTVEGLLVKKSVPRAVNGALTGWWSWFNWWGYRIIYWGVIFVILQGGLIGRVLGWIFLGLFLGLGQNILGFRTKRVVYGLAGGIIAGSIWWGVI